MKKLKDESVEDYWQRIERRFAEEKAFYETVASILKIEYMYIRPRIKRTRWNTRNIGNGRYEGFGIVRCYGQMVQIIFRKPIKVSKMFNTKDEAIDFIKKMVE